MILKINLKEIVEELTEDLEMQAGLVLTEHQITLLNQQQFITFTAPEIKAYWEDINEYLSNTQANERIWDGRITEDNKYRIFIQIETPYFKLSSKN